ncbi:hypothetical protein N7463_005341 [Penicillium fimorum]|uniref:Uncharacterized protein n=1 Tax=Penicillium fimorum TaxID=1882269 RepID=A0A9W9XSD7_9EURO|nr:hypothetical protein N7463_005341 [Penicillium fimorum]
MSSPIGCFHTDPKRLGPVPPNCKLPAASFLKPTYKFYDYSQTPVNIVHKKTSAQDCPICVCYGVRTMMLDFRPNPKHPKKTYRDAVNEPLYQYGFASYRLPAAAVSVQTPYTGMPFTFDVEKGQNGEAYHALICSLLTGNDGQIIRINIGKASQPATVEQQDLLYYYVSQKAIVDTPRGGDSRDNATKCIARVFEQNSEAQAQIFQSLRDYLNDSQLQTAAPADDTPSGGYPYASQAYAAKYWINRYLSLTEQGKSKLPTEQGTSKLPKLADVGKIALLLVRRAQKAGDGRSMTEGNIKTCLKSIRAANQAMAANGYEAFNYIIFYGDFDRKQALTLVRWAREFGLSALYITSPFKELNSKNDVDQQIDDFWSNFKGSRNSAFEYIPEGVPLEVKLFGFFLALQARYGSKLCYIGFRSGTLDGPGFIGSPIFYLDDTLTKGAWNDFASGNYLWDGTDRALQKPERMMFMTRTTNTFIRINIKGGDRNLIELDDDAAKQLGSALYLYMASFPAKDPYWTQRITMMNNPSPQQNELKQMFDYFQGMWRTVK